MATFNLHVGGPKGAELTKRADGQVNMGALLIRGTTDGDVKEATSATSVPWAVSLVREDVARENESNGVAQENYSDNNPCHIMTLVPGQVLNLEAGPAITEGDAVRAYADGKIEGGTGGLVIGRALEDISAGARGQVVILGDSGLAN